MDTFTIFVKTIHSNEDCGTGSTIEIFSMNDGRKYLIMRSRQGLVPLRYRNIILFVLRVSMCILIPVKQNLHQGSLMRPMAKTILAQTFLCYLQTLQIPFAYRH